MDTHIDNNEMNEEMADQAFENSKPDETKAEKFIRIGEYRMNKAIDVIGKLEKLSNKASYEYTPEQVDAMFGVLEKALNDAKSKFSASQGKEKAVFKF